MAVLTKMNFPPAFINIICQCISTVEYNFQLNGQVIFTLKPSRGIRQGDPLSPYLFLLAANVLSHLISKSVDEGQWKGIKISHHSASISYPLYADYSLLFMEANHQQFLHVKRTLEKFSLWLGQKINYSKSSLVFSLNTTHEDRVSLSTLIGVHYTRRLGKYLDMIIDPGRNKQTIYDQITTAISVRTASWKERLLSQASTLTLIKSVLSAANIYQLSCIRLPQKVCTQIDSMLADFFWGEHNGGKKMHLLGKANLFRSVRDGGLGLRKTTLVNQSLLAKQLWRIINVTPESMLGSTLKLKYISMDTGPLINKPYNSSWMWKGITQDHSIIYDHLKHKSLSTILCGGLCTQDPLLLPKQLEYRISPCITITLGLQFYGTPI